MQSFQTFRVGRNRWQLKEKKTENLINPVGGRKGEKLDIK